MSRRSKGTPSRKQYDVGYGKPPKAHQFKSGRSGNPRGRPKTTPSISEVAAKELKRRRKVIIDGEQVSLLTIEILIKKLVSDAAKGNFPALKALIQHWHLEDEQLFLGNAVECVFGHAEIRGQHVLRRACEYFA
jgi:Family of unknown function (DUF5681)